MHLASLHQSLAAAGAQACHVDWIMRRWLQALPEDARPKRPAQHLPGRLQAAWPEFSAQLDALARVVSRHPGADGSERLLMQLADGQMIETVLLLRDGLCVSTQVGCAVGCVFCMTGRSGLLRQLGSAEILAQVAQARRLRPVKKVVFMGMGEPAHNLDAVLEAIDWLGTAGGIGHKQLVLSTVGDPRVFERLPLQRVRPALALSLHSTQSDLRARLLPRAPRIDPLALVEAGEAWARLSAYPVQYQWTLLAGINDTEQEIDGIVRLLKGRYAVMNLIPYNPHEGGDGLDAQGFGTAAFQRPDWDHARAMVRALHRRGVLTKLRQSAGQDVDAGCGQLRARQSVAVSLPVPGSGRTARGAIG